MYMIKTYKVERRNLGGIIKKNKTADKLSYILGTFLG